MLGELLNLSLPLASLIAGLLSLMLSLACGSGLIRWLDKRFRERIASDSVRLNELHAAKQNTPTMGGLLIAGTALVAILLVADPGLLWVWIFCLVIFALTILGAADDWIKLRTSRAGLSARQKLLFQCLIACVAVAGIYLLRLRSGTAGKIWLPGTESSFDVGWIWFPWAVFVVVGASNAVNLTDGLDGLASGCTAITSFALTLVFCFSPLIAIDGSGRDPAAVSCAALAGSTFGFLWWNRHPARIFMGDAGSLPIGGLLALTALATATELLLALIGAVFVVETISVILQVGWYRRTRTRIFLCSPLHNHFVFRGVAEPKIVVLFWLATLFAAVSGLATVPW